MPPEKKKNKTLFLLMWFVSHVSAKKMLFVCLCFCGTFMLAARADDYDAPIFETAEEMRNIDNAYEAYLDQLTRSGAFKLFNGATGTMNATLAAELQAALEARLTEVATPAVRQCNRLSETPLACYACENGAANISRAEVDVVKSAKLYFSVHNNHDSAAAKTGPQSFSLPRNSFGYLFTASLPCRAVPTCFANTTTQLIRFELAGPRLVNFKRVAGDLLIDQMNLGSSFSQVTGNVFPTALTFGANQLVPQDIMDNPALMGIFCFVPSKRRDVQDSIVYFAHRGLPGIHEPSN